jgi:PAS domain S-box-containing protein
LNGPIGRESTPLKVLCLEDSTRDVEIIREALLDAGYTLDFNATSTEKGFVSLLRSRAYGVILSDFRLPGFDAFGALRWSREICPKTPFICVSGSIGEETAIELLKSGAVDYILKDRLTRLPFAVKRALDEAEDRDARRQAEEVLRESEDKNSALVNHSLDAILLTRPDGTVLSANQAACDMFGWSEEEICQRGSPSLVETNDPRLAPALEARVRKGSFRGELTFLRKDGTAFLCEVSSVMFSDRNGQQLTSMIIRDVTERKKAEQEILSLNTELEQRVRNRTLQLAAANRDLESFAYSVSHDLRAPLRGIDGWIGVIMQEHEHQLNESVRLYLDKVRFEVKRMGEMINGMLEFSRITRTEMRRERVNLSALSDGIIGRLRENDRGRDIRCSIQPERWTEGDPVLIEILLTNLFDNAWKFTGGKPDAQIEFGWSEDGNKQVFFVRDNGVGFDKRHADALFTPFKRLHKQSEFPGTGIGLATVQRIINRHGGRIWAESEPGKGATFYFTLAEEPQV